MPARTTVSKSCSARLAAFAAERDWDQFHNPKNLAMALAGEAGELIEHFQWLTPEEAANLLGRDARGSRARSRRRAAFPPAALRQARHRSRRGGRAQARAEREEIPGRRSRAAARRNTTSSDALLPPPVSRRQLRRRLQARAARAAADRRLARRTSPTSTSTRTPGIGRYDLTHSWAQKAREYENGIGRLWTREGRAAGVRAAYLEIVRALNPDGTLRYYPGSPLHREATSCGRARPHGRSSSSTRSTTRSSNRSSHARSASQCSLMDAYQALKAYLPPPERRGLVLIDSSFDRARELDRIVKALKEAHAPLAHRHVRRLVSADGARGDARFPREHRALGHTQGAAARDRRARARRERNHSGLRHARRESAVAFRRRKRSRWSNGSRGSSR